MLFLSSPRCFVFKTKHLGEDKKHQMQSLFIRKTTAEFAGKIFALGPFGAGGSSREIAKISFPHGWQKDGRNRGEKLLVAVVGYRRELSQNCKNQLRGGMAKGVQKLFHSAFSSRAVGQSGSSSTPLSPAAWLDIRPLDR